MKLLGDWLLEPAGSKHPHSLVPNMCPNMCFCPHQQRLCFWKVYCQANGIHMDELRISQHRSGSRNMLSGFFLQRMGGPFAPEKRDRWHSGGIFFFGRDDDPKVVIIEFWILECLSFIYLCPKLGEFASNGYPKMVKIDINQWLLGYSVFFEIQNNFFGIYVFFCDVPLFKSSCQTLANSPFKNQTLAMVVSSSSLPLFSSRSELDGWICQFQNICELWLWISFYCHLMSHEYHFILLWISVIYHFISFTCIHIAKWWRSLHHHDSPNLKRHVWSVTGVTISTQEFFLDFNVCWWRWPFQCFCWRVYVQKMVYPRLPCLPKYVFTLFHLHPNLSWL